MGRRTLDDLILFGRIASLALLFGGYILAGLYIGRQLALRGYPHWAMPLGALLGAIAGGAHAIMGVRDILQRRKR